MTRPILTIRSKVDSDNRRHRRRLAAGPISHRRLARILLRAFC